MAKNHLFTPQTIDADDEDTDICPVCDGLCTCQKQQRHQPSLKIKLTVPQNLITRHRPVSSNNAVQTTSDSVNRGYLPRKRGRPPKTKLMSRSRTHPPVSALNYKSKSSSSLGAAKIKPNSKARAALAKRAAVGRPKKPPNLRKAFDDDEEEENSSSTSVTDVDMDHSYPMSHFPTFVSASALESLGSSSDLDSDSDVDSSILRENKRTKATILLGDDSLRRKLGHPINHEWVIRSRKASVDLSEAEGGTDMDVDSDSDEEDQEKSTGLQDQEAEDEDEEDEAGTETTRTTPLVPFPDCQHSEKTDSLASVHPHHKQQRRRHFVRLGKTGWSFSSSEDEESGFDAELFFRYLYDASSSSSSSSSVDGDEEGEVTEGQDNDGPLTNPSLFPPRVESLPFELAESWDGGVVFTNGEGIGSADDSVGFVELEKLGRGGFGFRGRGDSDVEMGMADCVSCLEDGYLEEDAECEGDEDEFSFNEGYDDEGGIDGSYSEDEEQEGEGDGGSGDTTDEDLVGSDSLPNERAMGLFKVPLPVWSSVSAVDPLSLISTRPRRELEMMEVTDEKRRKGKGKNKGKGRMRRETREKGGREKRKEGKKRREMLPNPLDILEGRNSFWDMNVSEEEEETSCLSSSPGSFHRGHRRLRSPRTPTPTPVLSPTTPVPSTPALSTTSFSIGPKKGVFVVPPVVSEWTKSSKRKGKAREKATVIIGEDRKGEEVPSPHPRKRIGERDREAVEQLLKRHFIETIGAASVANINSDAAATTKTSPSTPHIVAPFSPIADDVFSLSSPTMRAIQLADVLDAEFLKDDDEEQEWGDGVCWSKEKCGSDDPGKEEMKISSLDIWGDDEKADALQSTESITTATIPSINSFRSLNKQAIPTATSVLIPTDTDLAADATAAKNLSRWDVISVGAFRQTQQQVRQEGGGESVHHHGVGGHGQLARTHARTPGSSTDYGNAMKKSGKFALGVLWRGSGTSPAGKGAKAAGSSSSGAASGLMRTSSGGMIGSKHAKKRRLTMNSSSTSVMKQPLVLPATSVGVPGSSSVASSSTASSSLINTNANGTVNSPDVNPNIHGKTRKEARRERKLQKRNSSQLYGPHPHSLHPHSHQHHHQHMYHTHYHHPNAKTRGMGSAQRLGGWFVGAGSGSGGGASGWGGAGTSSGASGFGGGFGCLGV